MMLLIQTEKHLMSDTFRSYQAFQQPRGTGDDDKKLLCQFCDEGNFRTLRTLKRLTQRGRHRRRVGQRLRGVIYVFKYAPSLLAKVFQILQGVKWACHLLNSRRLKAFPNSPAAQRSRQR